MSDRVEALAKELGRLPAGVDVAEIRLDGLWPAVPDGDRATDDLLALTDAARVPLLATLRPRRHGGRFEGPEPVRLGLLAAAGRAGFSALDMELDAVLVPGVLREMRSSGAAVLVSHHAWGPAPCRDDGLRPLLGMQDAGGTLDKLAFEAGAFPDALRALELAHEHARRGGRPAVSTLGFGGAPLRALLAIAGNHATYGHSPGLAPAVPGQPSIEDALRLWQHWGLGKQDLDPQAEGARPWLAVVGAPVLHSLSPRIHNAALRSARRPERFGALQVPASTGALRLAFHIASRIGLAGASITHPHKADAARLATCDSVATAVGAANCVRFDPTGPQATNTDATALRRLLAPHVHAGQRAAVLGSGGAARAAIWALRELGATVRFASRDPAKAQAVATCLQAAWVPWERRAERDADVWVQATPLGLAPGEPSPLPATRLADSPLLVELNYGSGPTALQHAAQAAGCRVVDGQTVLLEQAADAYRFWFASEPDRHAMAAALEGVP
jgi:3-dehydroquinate dehydratase/shikimate dehydrogenase